MRTRAVFLLLAILTGCAAAPAAPPLPPGEAFQAGEAALLTEDFAAAETAFTQALEEAGDDDHAAAQAAYWLGVCRRKRGDSEGARAALVRALAGAQPAVDARARLQLGDLAWEARRWLEAREMYSGAARDISALTTEELLHARRRGAQAAIRAGDWNDGQGRMETWGPSAESPEWTLVRHVATGGQFACALGPFTALAAERHLERLADAGRGAEPWSRGDAVWLIVRPFEDWAAAAGAAEAWRTQQLPAVALP